MSIPRQAWARILASLLASLSLVLGILGAPTPAAADESELTEITDGTVVWGFKKSWRNYTGPTAVTLSGGVKVGETGEYVWPIKQGTFNKTTNATHLDLDGTLHYQWYKEGDIYLLDITFSDVSIDISSEQQVITANYKGSSRENPGKIEDYGRITVSTLDLSKSTFSSLDDETNWSNIETLIAEVPLYSPGTQADPVAISYKGPGGKPALEEINKPSAPHYELAESFALNTEPNSGSHQLISLQPNNNIAIVSPVDIRTDNAAVNIQLIDPASMQETSTSSVKLLKSDKYSYTSDGQSKLFVLHRNPDERNTYTIDVVSVEGNKLSAPATLTNITDKNIRGLFWDHVRQRLIVISSIATPGQSASIGLRFIDIAQPEEQPQLQVHPNVGEIPGSNAFTAQDNRWKWGSLCSLNSCALWDVPTVLSDGSYVFGTSSGFRVEDFSFIPARPLLIKVDLAANTANSHFLADMTPSTIDDSNAALQARTYAGVLEGNNSELIGSAGSFPEIGRYYTISGSETTPITEPIFGDQDIYASSTIDRNRNYLVSYASSPSSVFISNKDGILSSFTDPRLVIPSITFLGQIITLPNSDIVLVGRDQNSSLEEVHKFAYKGTYASITGQPTDQTVDLGTGESGTATFTVGLGEHTGDATIKWQSKAPGTTRFADIDGATSDTLDVTANKEANGTVYRAVITDDLGSVASDSATLTVNSAPDIIQHPRSLKAEAGTQPVFHATATGSPEPEFTWQRYDRTSGLWIDIPASDDNFTINNGEGNATLTVASVNGDMNGTQLRIKAHNSNGTTYSRVATIGVNNDDAAEPGATATVTDVTLQWGVGNEIQHQPPAGGSNYLSAGTSDGSESTYSTEDGNVSVAIVDPAIAQDPGTAPTYDKRNAFLKDGKQQVVRFKQGKGTLGADGSAHIDWEGAFSVNFYGGMVPFTITNPTLDVDNNGIGTLTADLSGYGSQMDDPTHKHEVAPRERQTIATFSGVKITPEGVITIDPDYSGVEVEVTGDATPQNRTALGWGAWPQNMVDFQLDTGLSSYWYTSNPDEPAGKKAPLTLGLDFTEATVEGGTTPPGGGDDTNPGGTTPSGASEWGIWQWIPAVFGILGLFGGILGALVGLLNNPDGPIFNLRPAALAAALKNFTER